MRLPLALREEPRGFADLERALGVTSKPLAERLDALRCRGFVTCEVHPTGPSTTTYRLTEAGRAFADRLVGLSDLVALAECDCGETCAVPAAPDEATCCVS